LLGVSLSHLAEDPGADQLALFQELDSTRETERDRRLSRAVDRVRARFGTSGILPGSLVSNDADD
jgi:hypothetical protein